MKDYRAIEGLIEKDIDLLHSVYDIAYEKGLQDGKVDSYSKLDMEQEYQHGFIEGQKSVVLNKDMSDMLHKIAKQGTYEDGLKDMWNTFKYIVEFSYSHSASKFRNNLDGFLRLTPRRAMDKVIALRCKGKK